MTVQSFKDTCIAITHPSYIPSQNLMTMGDHYISPRKHTKPVTYYETTAFQILALKCTGFVRLDSNAGEKQGFCNNLVGYALTGFGVCLVVAGWISFGFNAAIALGSLLHPDPNSKVNAIMQAFTLIPFATYNVRGVIILTILLWKRRQWVKLVTLVNRTLADTFPQGNSGMRRHWRTLSIGAAAATLCLLLTFETLNNLQTMAVANKNLTSDGILDPLPLPMIVWQYFVFWTACSAFPFFLSQQVAISILIIGKILADCCRRLARDLREEMETLRVLHSTNPILDVQFGKGDLQRADVLQDTTDRVINLKLHYLGMFRIVHYVNHHFGSFIFCLYGLDLLTMFGSVASIVESMDKGNKVIQAYYYASTLIFMLHCTVFIWPLVMAYEESLKINVLLHQFLGKVEAFPSFVTAQGRQLHTVVQTFVLASRHQQLMFSGAEVLHITRTFIFTTFTLLVSFVVITREVLQREEPHGSPCHVAVANATESFAHDLLQSIGVTHE